MTGLVSVATADGAASQMTMVPNPPPNFSPNSAKLDAPAVQPAGGLDAAGPLDDDESTVSLRHVFVRGVFWTSLATIIGKIASFISQFLLGRMFSEDVYGLFAMAITAATVGEVFASGGIKTVVVARANDFSNIARTAAYVAQGVSFLAAMLIAATAPIFAYLYFGQPAVMPLLFILAFALFLGSMGSVHRAKLDADIRAKSIALIETGASVLRHSLVVVLAYAGWQEQSFVWAVVCTNLWYTMSARLLAGPLPKSQFRWPLAWALLRQGKWVIFTGIGATIIARGDYFVGGGFAGIYPNWKGILGLYFFGYQLTQSLFGPFNISLQSLMQPAFAKLKGNLDHQATTYFNVVRMTVFVAVPFTIAGALVVPLMIQVLWPSGRWDPTIRVVQLLAITESVRQLHFISVAVLSARERFQTASYVTLVDGLTTMGAALIGCLIGQFTSYGGLISLTVAIAIQRTIMSLIEAAIVYRMIGGSSRAILSVTLKPVVPAVVLGALLYGVVRWIWPDPFHAHVAAAAIAAPVFILHAVLLRLMARKQFDEAMALFSRLLPARFRKPLPSIEVPAP